MSDEVKIGWQYAELLKSVGIELNAEEIDEKPKIDLKIRYICCDEGNAWTREGMLICWKCGKVLNEKLLIDEELEYPEYGKPLGHKSRLGPVDKPRVYKRLIHFKEHIRRYVGARFTPVPDSIMEEIRKLNINTDDPKCYFTIKQALKQLKHPKLYKEIFTIIYDLGGHRPKIDSIIPDLYEQYKQFDIYYEQIKQECRRKNGVSYYMILDLMLKELGHESYYEFPYLKNEELQDDVLEIFKHIRKEQKKDAVKL